MSVKNSARVTTTEAETARKSAVQELQKLGQKIRLYYYSETSCALQDYNGTPENFLHDVMMRQKPEIIVAPTRIEDIFSGTDVAVSPRLLNGFAKALETWNQSFPEGAVDIAEFSRLAKIANGQSQAMMIG